MLEDPRDDWRCDACGDDAPLNALLLRAEDEP